MALGGKINARFDTLDILHVAQKIAQGLGLKVDDVLSAKILTLELGLTFKVDINPVAIANAMYRYEKTKIGWYDSSRFFEPAITK